MDVKNSGEMNEMMNMSDQEDEIMMEDLRRGPWTVEEDFALINYISQHGEGRWNSLARSAGLKRTGKSCRLRWLNYLRPDVRRGNITLEEQLLILELHSRWGNRWSKIAQYLPGRTDNEIKNYWRTRVQKHAKQLKCDVNSKQFKDTMRYLWMPRLVEKIQASSSSATRDFRASTATAIAASCNTNNINLISQMMPQANCSAPICNSLESIAHSPLNNITHSYTPENSTTASSGSFDRSQVSPASDITDCCNYPLVNPIPDPDSYFPDQFGFSTESLISPTTNFNQGLGFEFTEPATPNPWMDGENLSDNLWSNEDISLLSQQFNNNI